jgi:hypothetical protein
MPKFKFDQIENVFVFGAGISTAYGIPVGDSLLADIFRIYNIPGRVKNDEGPNHEAQYLKVIENCKKLYNIPNCKKTNTIGDFAKCLENSRIDFEDYLSRIYLSNQLMFQTDKSSRELVEPNFMRLMYWYFWHHKRNWKDQREFPEANQNANYLDLFFEKLDSRSSILTTNYDLLFESDSQDPSTWKVAYSPEWIRDDNKVLYLKLHGSINWIARWSIPEKIQIISTLGQIIGSVKEENVDSYPDLIVDPESGNNIKIINNYFSIIPTLKVVIMPPIFYKGMHRGDRTLDLMIQEIWGNAIKCLKHARKIIFAGFSMRETDLMLQLLLKKNISEKSKVYLVNWSGDNNRFPKEGQNIYKRYQKTFDIPIDRFYDMKFEDFVKTGEIWNVIGQP